MPDKILSLLDLWVLAVLIIEPGHPYEIPHRIAGHSLMRYRPSLNGVRGAVRRLAAQGLIKVIDRELGLGSRHLRQVYAATQAGEDRLALERRTLDLQLAALNQAVATALIRR